MLKILAIVGGAAVVTAIYNLYKSFTDDDGEVEGGTAEEVAKNLFKKVTNTRKKTNSIWTLGVFFLIFVFTNFLTALAVAGIWTVVNWIMEKIAVAVFDSLAKAAANESGPAPEGT